MEEVSISIKIHQFGNIFTQNLKIGCTIGDAKKLANALLNVVGITEIDIYKDNNLVGGVRL